ncbi:MAG: hypothetical protein ACLUEC_02535 [Coprococcus sp.]
MIALIQFLLLIFWVLDITNMPFMEMFDTTYPMNEVFWLLIWIFVLGFEVKTKKNDGGLSMSRLTRKETIIIRGNETAACNYENNECNDSCRYGICEWQEKANMRLKKYEDTGLTPEQVQQLKERDTEKKPIKTTEETGIRYTDSYRCPNCGGNFTGTGIADFCYHCGQRLDWSE